jgi:hypothetical protein
MNEYARVLVLQNQGIPCPYCQSLSGHYATCPLLTPKGPNVNDTLEIEADKVREYVNVFQSGYDDIPRISENDKISLSGLGVIW